MKLKYTEEKNIRLSRMLDFESFRGDLDIDQLSYYPAVTTVPLHLPNEEYRFQHENAIIIWHGIIFCAWYNCPENELAGFTPIRGKFSRDGGKSWSKPRKFDDFGVLPQILTLPCGVTLAAYGRPKLRIRATADPSGLVWEEPITVPLSAPVGTSPFQTSCFYTDFLPLDDTTVLWVYTDFQHPNEQGEPAKAVLVREVKVVRD